MGGVIGDWYRDMLVARMKPQIVWYALVIIRWAVGLGLVWWGLPTIHSQEWSFFLEMLAELFLFGLVGVFVVAPISYRGAVQELKKLHHKLQEYREDDSRTGN